MKDLNPSWVSRRIKQILLVANVLLFSLLAGIAAAHNLDASAVYTYFDEDTRDLLDARIANESWIPPQPLLKVGDEIGLIIKALPDNGTDTGVGGYTTFYVPNGVQIIDVAFVIPGDNDADGIKGYDRIPGHGQAAMPSVGSGGDSTVSLVGYSRGPNILDVTSDMVDAGNANLGTLPGVYGDNGIFFSTAPETAFGSYPGSKDPVTGVITNSIKNNSGDIVGHRTSRGTPLNAWDAWQMQAYGISGTTNPDYVGSPIIDSNGRGSAPWGLASAVAGPESGYAWQFDLEEYRDCTLDKAAGSLTPAPECIDAATDDMGPWNRIKYAGSTIADDPPGSNPPDQPYVSGEGTNIGHDLSAAPLPATVSQTDSTSPNAIRWAFGQLTLLGPEFAWVKLKITDASEILDDTGCPIWWVDTFGGDAGGDSGGKDHIWRYYDPTSVILNGCVAIGKIAEREAVQAGDYFEYEINYYNAGDNDMYNVALRDILPSGVNFISSIPAQDSGPNPLVWQLGNVLRGESFRAVVTVEASGSGALSNELCIEGTNADGEAYDSCTNEETPSGSIPIMVQNKSVSPTSIAPGGQVQYTIKIDNIGSGPSGNPYVISEYLPVGFSFVSLDSVIVNNADLTGSTTVDATDLNKPVFTVPAGVDAQDSLVLTFTAVVSLANEPEYYCNSFTGSQGGINHTTGALACVNVGGGKIGGNIFNDWLGTGSYDFGDDGIEGVTLELLDCGVDGVCGGAGAADDGPTKTVTTDEDGNYLFEGLAPATGLSGGTGTNYQITVLDGTGTQIFPYSQTVEPGSTGPVDCRAGEAGDPCSNIYIVNLTEEDDQDLENDFGYMPGGVGAIGDTVWDDSIFSGTTGTPDDGIQNGNEPGISGVEVVLYEDTNGNGVIDDDDTELDSTTTNGTGNYSFTGLAEGVDYLVRVPGADPVLTSYFNSAPYNSAYRISTPLSSLIARPVTNLTGTYNDADFGYFAVVASTLSGQAFQDENANFDFDPGTDVTLEGVTVWLCDNTPVVTICDGTNFDEVTTTASNGTYFFGNLTVGNFVVGVDETDPDIPDGYVPSTDNIAVTLPESANITDIDFPFTQLLTKSASNNSPSVGDNITYTIRPTYAGSDLLGSVVVTDPVPANTTFVSAAEGGFLGAGPGGPTTIDSTKDTFLRQNSADRNYGVSTALYTGKSPNNAQHALVQFDLSAIPSTATITSATLSMTKSAGDADVFPETVHLVTAAWDEGGNNDANTTPNEANWTERTATDVAWATPGGDYNTTALDTTSVGVIGTYTWDVTSAAQSWADGSTANNGLLLKRADGNAVNKQHIYDSAETTTGTAPQLTVSYTNGNAGEVTWHLGSNTAGTVGINPGGTDTFSTPAQIDTVRNANSKDALPDVYAVGDNVYSVFINNSARTYFTYSSDKGSTWSTAGVLPQINGEDKDRNAAIAVHTDGTIHVVYDNESKNVYYTRSTNNGTSWSTPAEIDTAFGDSNDKLPRIALDSSGNPYVVFNHNGENTYLVKSADAGLNWGSAAILPAINSETKDRNVDIAIDSSNNLHVVIDNENKNVFYLKSINGGTSWINLAEIDRVAGDSADKLPRIDVDGLNPYVVFNNNGASTYFNKSTDGGGTWVGASILPLINGELKDTLSDISVDSDGNIHVVIENENGRNVFYTNSVDDGATWETPREIDTATGDSTDRTPVVATSGGKVHVVFGQNGENVFYTGADLLPINTNSLTATPGMMTGPSTITVLQTLYSDKAVTAVSPGTPTATGTNGSAITTGSCAYAPAGTQNITAGGSVNFTWTCPVTVGTVPGTVSLLVDASGDSGATTFQTATSNTAIVTPPLTFMVQVTTAGAEIENTASIYDVTGTVGSPSTPSDSNTVTTAVKSTVGDTIWEDWDADGVKDAGEPGISGIVVELDDGICIADGIDDGNGCPSDTTDGSGLYFFSGIEAGNYSVIVNTTGTVLENYNRTYDLDGTGTPNEASFTLAEGEVNNNVDFGYQPTNTTNPSQIGDQVFIDAGNDGGAYIPGTDAPMPNVMVKLYRDVNGDGLLDDDDLLYGTQSTDASGQYLFDNLPDGKWIVDVVENDPANIAPGLTPSADKIAITLPVCALTVCSNLTADFPFVEGPELITKSVVNITDPTPSNPGGFAETGDVLEYTLEPYYDGTELLYNAIVSDDVPAGSTFLPVGSGVSPNAGGTHDGGTPGTVSWLLGTNLEGVPGVLTGASGSVVQRVLAGLDDAEEVGAPGTYLGGPGHVEAISTDIELVADIEPVSSGNQTIGLRFQNITVPPGTVITSAKVTFRGIAADSPNTNNNTANLTIYGQDVDDAPAFVNDDVGETSFSISSRAKVSSTVAWAPSSWTTGSDYDTPDISSIVQDIVDRGGWSSGNSMVIIMDGTGSRSSPSYNGDSVNAAQLTINYASAATTNVLSAVDHLVTAPETVTVTMTLRSPTSDTNVTPSAMVGKDNVDAINGIQASCTQNTPLTQNITGGTPITFTWDCDLTTGSNGLPGNVVFGASAAGDALTFVSANSNSVIATPPLKFRVTAGSTEDPIINFGNLSSTGTAIPGDPTSMCYAISDGGLTAGADDALSFINPVTSATSPIGTGTGTTFSETATWSLDGTTLYTTDQDSGQGGQSSDLFGTINTTTGLFTAYTSTEGPTCVGRVACSAEPLEGSIGGTPTNLTVLDIDGMAVDGSGNLYAVHRRESGAQEDLLLQIDPATGLHVEDAFGAGVDYVELDSSSLGLYGTDDISFDPATGTLYGSLNTTSGGAYLDRLVIIDPTDGSITDVARLTNAVTSTGLTDVEGLSFGGDGVLYGNTAQGDTNDPNTLWTIDTDTGVATKIGSLVPSGTNYSDYEALACKGGTLPTAGEGGLDSDSNKVLTALSPSIGDTVWSDLNGNGTQDGVEPGIPGVTVYIDTNGNGVLDWTDGNSNGVWDPGEGEQWTATDASGEYFLRGLSDSVAYTVTVDHSTLPEGVFGTTPPTVTYTLSAGEQYADADFGYLPPVDPPTTSSIGDTIWIDADEDGVVDYHEDGIENVIVNLWVDADESGDISAGDFISQSTLTDADGQYLFDGLPPGDFLVEVDETSTAPTPQGVGEPLSNLDNVSGTTSNVHAVTNLAASTDYETADFGYNWNGSIGDLAWYDKNGNSVQDGPINPLLCDNNDPTHECGAPNATIQARVDSNNNGYLDASDQLFEVQVTGDGTTDVDGDGTIDPVGYYNFNNLPPGDYYIIAGEQEVPAPDSSPKAGLIGTMIATTNTFVPVVLASGEVRTDVDFGFKEAAILGGKLWHDINANGLIDSGEALPDNTGSPVGVTITLTGIDINGIAVTETTTTDARGNYEFVVDSGNYTISYSSGDPNIPSTLTTATTPLSVSVEVSAGEERGGLNFGVDNSGAIGDLIWNDANGDGIQDAGEAGIEGVTVQLYTSDGTTLIATQASDATGKYEFIGLEDSGYIVKVAESNFLAGGLLEGLSQTGDPDEGDGTAPDTCVTCDNQGSSTISGGSQDYEIDFGYMSPGLTYSVGGNIWDDNSGTSGTAGDGIKDTGEPDLSGVTVIVEVDTNNDGTVDQTYSVVTDSNGDYNVSGIPSGSKVTVTVDTSTLPSGAYVNTGDPDVTPPNGTPGDCAGCNSTTVVTTLTSDVTDLDFGYDKDLGSIAGTVCDNGGGNGDCAETGEVGVEGVTVFLTGAGPDGLLGTSDDIVQATTTDANGDYSFTDLGPGPYTISISNPDGKTNLADADGGNANSIYVDLAVGDDETNQDFELTEVSGAVGDLVWFDMDRDGVYDIGEPGLANAAVALWSTGVDGIAGNTDDVLVATEITSMDGKYLFDDVPVGEYYVTVDESTIQSGLTETAGTVNPGTEFTLTGGEANLDQDFGYVGDPTKSVIGNFVWSDENNDGIQDAGEPGIGGVTIDLLNESGGVIASTITAEDGSYYFVGIDPGRYRIDVTDTIGVLDDYDLTSGPQSSPDPTDIIDVSAGEAYLAADFGYNNAALNDIMDRVWYDADRDGFQDPGETGIVGVTIDLYEDTDGDGSFTKRIISGLVDLNGDGTIDASDTTGAGETWNGYELISGVLYSGGSPLTGVTLNGVPVINGVLDMDGNGSAGAGDNGEMVDEPIIATAVTNDLGDYAFAGLEDGDYVMSVSDNVGLLSDYQGTTPSGQAYQKAVTVAGADVNAVSFGYVGLGPIGDTIFSDANGNGIQDPGEVGISGVMVELFADTNGDGVFTPGTDSSVGTAVTDSVGQYAFNDLVSATYFVSVDDTQAALSAYTPTTTDQETATATDTEIGAQLASGTTKINVIAGRLDVNGDGIISTDDDDPVGVHGVEVIDGDLDLNGDGTVDGNDDGWWNGTEVIDGQLNLDDSDSVINASDAGNVTVSQSSFLNADFGYQNTMLADVTGTVFNDINLNAVFETSEPRFEGVTVSLVDCGTGTCNDGDETVVATTVTAADGSYSFLDVAAGDYKAVVSDESDVLNGFSLTSGLDEIQITVPATGSVDDVNFGYARSTGTASIGDTVWLDANGNGVFESNESGLAGVNLTLNADRDNDGTIDTTVDVLANALDLNSDGLVNADDNGAWYGVNVYSGGLDVNGDGIVNSDDDGIVNGYNIIDGAIQTANATIDGAWDTTTTNSNGTYLFDGLPSGNFQVDVNDADIDAGLETGTGTTDPSSIINLSNGEAYLDADFGYIPSSGKAVIGDTVWYDVDGNGIQDPGETGIGGVTVKVTNGSGTVFEIVTEPDGSWLLVVDETATPSSPAEYIVSVDKGTLPGSVVTTPTNMGGGDTYILPVAEGDVRMNLDFGYEGGVGVIIGDEVYLDSNGDGNRDAGEEGISGVSVVVSSIEIIEGKVDVNGDGLIDSSDTGTDVYGGFDVTNGVLESAAVGSVLNGYTVINDGSAIGLDINGNGVIDTADNLAAQVVSSTVTDANGNYLITGLLPGDYRADVSGVPGMTLTTANDPTGIITLDTDSGTAIPASDLTVDFGYTPRANTAAIGDRIWSDDNGNGIQDEGEIGIGGVTVSLTPPSGGDAGCGIDVVCTTTTSADGSYLFTNVPAAAETAYTVSVDTSGVLSGYTQTGEGDPGTPCSGSCDNAITVTVGPTSGVVNTAADFGYQGDTTKADGSIIGTLYDDVNGNSNQDGGDDGLDAVTVQLVNANGEVLATTTTDSNGDYSFTGLPAGDYSVVVQDGTAAFEGKQSTEVPTLPISIVCTTSCSDITDVDFGYTQVALAAGSLGDTVYFDTNGDGNLDAGEVGISGVTVDLLSVEVIDGYVDRNGDGVISTADSGLAANGEGYGGYNVIDGALDIDGNGSINASDTGVYVNGYFVIDGRLDTNNDSSVNTSDDVAPVLLGTKTTGPDGTYSFSGLAANDYRVVVTDTNGVLSDLTATEIAPPQTVTCNLTNDTCDEIDTADFGYRSTTGGTGTLGGTVWRDIDQTTNVGTLQDGEPGIQGVAVELWLDTNNDGKIVPGTDNLVRTTVTDANGDYLFLGLPPGNYIVNVVDNKEVIAGKLDMNGDGVIDTSDDGVYAGYNVIDGALDIDGNGSIDGSDNAASVSGIEVIGGGLDIDPNSVINGNDDGYVGDGVTGQPDSNVLDGLTSVTGPNPTVDSNGHVDPYAVTLALGAVDTSVDFAYEAQTPFALSGVVFEDAGTSKFTWDDPAGTGDDAYLPGATVRLYAVVDGVELLVGTTIADGAGAYSFTDLADGVTYRVRVDTSATDASSWEQTVDPDFTPADPPLADTDCDTCDSMTEVTINNANVSGLNFGYWNGDVVTTPVTLSYFEATAGEEEGDVQFNWSTVTEAGNVGFDLYVVSDDDVWTRVNMDFIPAIEAGPTDLRDYSFFASGVPEGAFYIVDIDIMGVEMDHGPFKLNESYGRKALKSNPIDIKAIQDEHDAKKKARKERKKGKMKDKLKKKKQKLEKTGRWDTVTQAEPNWATRLAGGVLSLLVSSAQAAELPVTDTGLIQLHVAQSGVYRVSYEQLADAGLDLAGVDKNVIALTNMGEPMPVNVVNDRGNKKAFGKGWYIEFLGEELETMYSKTNVYSLYLDKDKAERMLVDKRNPSRKRKAKPWYLETTRVEVDASFDFSSPGGDPWYMTRMLAYKKAYSNDFEIDLQAYAGNVAPVNLGVDMYGVTNWPEGLDDHHVQLQLNGKEVADEWFDGLVNYPLQLELPSAVSVEEGLNTLTITLPWDTGYLFDLVNLDGYEVSYPRRFEAKAGQYLDFSASGALFEVKELVNKDVLVYRTDIDGSIYIISRAKTKEQGDGSFSVRFRGTTAEANYLVVTEDAIQSPALLPPPDEIDITSQEGKYVIIAHPDFIGINADEAELYSLEDLKLAREQRGFSVVLADLEQVYAQFGHGVVDAQAIKDYIAYAYKNMGTEMVLLVGGDTFDYHGNLGPGPVSFVPSLYAQTDPIVHFAPVDPKYADVDDDNLPDLAIGRFPVRSSAELSQMVHKTLVWDSGERNSGEDAYGQTALFIADGYDAAQKYDFKKDAEIMRAVAPSEWQPGTTQAYLDDISVPLARSSIIDTLNAGVALTSFVGHSGYSLWTFDNLFSAEDAIGLSNDLRPTVVTQWGCWNTYYVSNTEDTMAHEFLLNGEQGAVAVLGASTLTEAPHERQLARLIYDRLFVPGVDLGTAILSAKQQYAETAPEHLDVILGWTLLGDPALMMAEQ